MAMAELLLEQIDKHFGETRVLGGIDLKITPGEFLTLVGPSGCGKSTLLRIIAGLEAPTRGRVRIAGEEVTRMPPSRRNLAMVFQSYALYPHLSVADNMLTPLKLRDLSAFQRLPLIGPLVSRRERAALLDQVKAVAETLQITDLLDRKPGQLSGGQRQRVALGRAMVRRPVAFLMDEPLSNLDAALRVHMRAELTDLHRALGTTFVYVTHDQAEALTMSSRMAVIMHGDLLQVGVPDDVYANPANLKVASFIGSPKINVLEARADASGHLSLVGRDLGVQADPGERVQIGIRPEHLRLAETDDGAMGGKVVYRENLGSDIFLRVGLESGNHRVTVRTTPAEAAGLSLGDHIAVRANLDAVLVFDAHGERLQACRLAKGVLAA